MRRLVATLLIVACASLTTGCGALSEALARNDLGELRTVEGRGFEIQLPCDPTESTDSQKAKGLKLTIHTLMCDGGDIAYTASAMVFPKGVPLDLDGAAQGSAAEVGGTVVSNKFVRYGGLKGRDIHITSTYEGEPATLFQRVLLRKRTAYIVQVAVVGKEDAEAPDLYGDILDSLTLD